MQSLNLQHATNPQRFTQLLAGARMVERTQAKGRRNGRVRSILGMSTNEQTRRVLKRDEINREIDHFFLYIDTSTASVACAWHKHKEASKI